MNVAEIRFKPLAEVVFTREELLLMFECSTNHYDSKCKSYSLEGHTTGDLGLLRGMMNREAFTPGCSHTLSFGQLDTLAKILEVGYAFRGRPDGIEKEGHTISLGFEIHKAMTALNDNTPVPVKPT